MIHKIKSFWPILVILLLAFLLRIYKLEELFYFTYDESVPAFVGRRILLWQHVPLIGGVSPFGVHLTPYFYWFLSTVLALGKLNPIAWGWVGAAFAMLTTIMMYVVGTKFANKKVGITAAIFWAFSYLTNVYDRHLWALYPGPLLSLLVLFSLYKIKKGSENFIFVLSLAIIIGVSADPSNLVFVVLTIIVFAVYKLPVSKKTLISIGIFLISFLPLVFFDLRHNFANSRPFLEFWQQGRNNPGFSLDSFSENILIFPQAFTRLIYAFSDNEVAKQYSYCSAYVTEKYNAIPFPLVLASLFLLSGFLIWAFTNKNKTDWKFVALLTIIYFAGIQVYGTVFQADIFEHYLTGLFAVFLLIFAKVVSIFPKKIWLVILAIFVSANLYKLSTAKNSHGLVYKRQAIEFAMQNLEKNDFSLESHSTCWRLSGYRYLFAVFGEEPVKSYVDPNFGYLYGTTPIAEEHPETVVAIVTHDFTQETDEFYRRYALLKSHEVKNDLFGNIEVIIMDNSTGWFDRGF